MTLTHRRLIVIGSLAGLLGLAGPEATVRAQGAAALSGQVSSSDEGPMEGVLVSAKKDGATITTTVVTRQRHRRSEARPHQEPGRSALERGWTGSMLTDRVSRLDLSTGHV